MISESLLEWTVARKPNLGLLDRRLSVHQLKPWQSLLIESQKVGHF